MMSVSRRTAASSIDLLCLYLLVLSVILFDVVRSAYGQLFVHLSALSLHRFFCLRRIQKNLFTRFTNNDLELEQLGFI